MLPEFLIMLLESLIVLLENIYSAGITHDECSMFIVQATFSINQFRRGFCKENFVKKETDEI
jgi:hypothetical protein